MVEALSELNLEILRKLGFSRKTCKSCGSVFWTTIERDNCGEFPCGEMLILTEKIFDRRMTISEMRKAFIDFFRERGHTPIDRYPVVARWREDVFLVNASIYDFQPHVTSGKVPPPANPLVISQPCIRLVDIDFVGKTTRHLTGFEMMAHHAFNYPHKEVYWKEETVNYCLEFLSSQGVSLEHITLKEKPWFGGGNAGNAFEVIVGGLEVATLVFMDLREDPKGSIELEGHRYSKMDVRVVDTGYGLERLVWASRAYYDSPTIYDAIYPDLIEKMCSMTGLEKERSIDFAKTSLVTDERYSNIYAICDHTRSITFMLVDGVVPSNSKEGYLARLLIRRVCRALKKLGIDISLGEIIEWQLKNFEDILGKYNLNTIKEMLELEEIRFEETLKKGYEILNRKLREVKEVSTDMLIEMYDSHGIPPEIVKEVCDKMNVKVHIPDDFHRLVVMRHERAAAEKKESEYILPALPPTRKLYYEDQYAKSFVGKVIYVSDNVVVLDQTLFYPEGGGQPGDTGILKKGDVIIKVLDTKIQDDVVLHLVDDSSKISVGDYVEGLIDWDRRYRIMVHHTSTHVLLASLRKVLGDHIWQAGAQKGPFESRFDVTHYKPVSREEIKEIEKASMEIIQRMLPVRIEYLSRDVAEKTYGFRLYEGGVPEGDTIRIVSIEGVDAEACGGTHIRNTGEIGILKILSTERIQDGVVRFTFASGKSALERIQQIEDDVVEVAQMLRVPKDSIKKGVEKFIGEWKSQRKEIEKLSEFRAKYEKIKLLSESYTLCDLNIVIGRVEDPVKVAEEFDKDSLKGYILVLISSEGKYVVKTSENIDLKPIGNLLREVLGGGFGGKSSYIIGGGRNIELIDVAITKCKDLIEKMVREWRCKEL